MDTVLAVDGRIKAISGIIAIVVIVLCFISFGIYFIVSSNANVMAIDAKVISKECRIVNNYNIYNRYDTRYGYGYGNRNPSRLECIYGVKYQVNNQEYTNKVSLDVDYGNKETLTIYYDTTNPNNIYNKDPKNNKYIGLGLIVCALIVAILGGITMYNVMTSDSAAINYAITS